MALFFAGTKPDRTTALILTDATARYPYATADWAQRWPVEEVWKARKR